MSKYAPVDYSAKSLFYESGKYRTDRKAYISMNPVIEQEAHKMFKGDPNPFHETNEHLKARRVVSDKLTTDLRVNKSHEPNMMIYDKTEGKFRLFEDAIVNTLTPESIDKLYDATAKDLVQYGINSKDDFIKAGLHRIGFDGEPEYDYKVNGKSQKWENVKKDSTQVDDYTLLMSMDAKDMFDNPVNTKMIKDAIDNIFKDRFTSTKEDDGYRDANILLNKERLLTLIALKNGIDIESSIGDMSQGRAAVEKGKENISTATQFEKMANALGFRSDKKMSVGEQVIAAEGKTLFGRSLAQVTYGREGANGKQICITYTGRQAEARDIAKISSDWNEAEKREFLSNNRKIIKNNENDFKGLLIVKEKDSNYYIEPDGIGKKED